MQQAVAKAKLAYGDSVEADLANAIANVRMRPDRLDHCMRVLHMTTVSKAVLWARIRGLTG